jgi:hypothetical protein
MTSIYSSYRKLTRSPSLVLSPANQGPRYWVWQILEYPTLLRATARKLKDRKRSLPKSLAVSLALVINLASAGAMSRLSI